jgi:hypothetical protein
MKISKLARSKILHLILTASLICVLPARTFAWGEKGHRIIAALAWLKLSDNAKHRINELLGETADSTGPLTAVAIWADNVKSPEQRKWHFVSIPRGAEAGYDAKRDCPNRNCLVEKLEEKKRELQYGRSNESRIEALKYLVHLVGDLHQPLHCTDDNDANGNNVQVTFFGRPTNLHKLWDSDMIERTGLREEKYLKKLRAIKTSQGFWFRDWANDSHYIAGKYVYDIPRDGELGNDYYTTNLPILDQQLAKAGTRLAQVLEDALSSPKAK